MEKLISNYHLSFSTEEQDICNTLQDLISKELKEASSKIWHAHPVWFINDNPIVGYSKQKNGIRLMFWSGADFEEDILSIKGAKFKDASVFFNQANEINKTAIKRCLKKSRDIQWDYKNIVKRKGKLEKIIIVILLMFFSLSSKAQQSDGIINPNYDKALAEKLGANDYGMKSYYFVMLKTGENNTNDKEFISTCFKGHMENISKLVKENKLIVAGPISKNEKNYRGIFIFNNVKDQEELVALLMQDLAIKNKLLDYEIYTWFGSAALPEYLPFSEKIRKKNP